MTPHRPTRNTLFVRDHGEAGQGVRLFEGDNQDEHMEEEEEGLTPPPRMVSKNAALPSAQLFGNNADNVADATRSSIRRRKPRLARMSTASSDDNSSVLSDVSDQDSVLRNMDLNTSQNSHRRKRPSDQQPAGREELMLDSDNDEEMVITPRISPSYRTLDGRTVTSRNPFSPYTPTPAMEALDMCNTNNDSMQTAPTFPVTLTGSHSFDSMDSLNHSEASSVASMTAAPHLRPKGLHLPRRDSTAFPREGYPDQHGRYSFTGSPIEEIDIHHDNNHGGSVETACMGSKIRRLRLSDNASTAAQSLMVDMEEANKAAVQDEISPTDVTQFPPAAPRKAPRYTPLRPTAPHTPKPERRNVARRPLRGGEEDDDHAMHMDSTSSSPTQIKSRFYQDFDIIGELGTGSFGTVYKCLSRLDGCMYAVKAAKRKAKGNADRDRMLKEVYALAALSDQADTAAFHCVRYHQAWMEENRLYIQTELCSSTLQNEMGQQSTERKWKLLREMLLALEFIHRNGMVHLDIKPENIFVKNDQFKLGDFGLVSKTTCSNDVEEGDSRYMSRELLSGEHDDLTKSDIFSLGATMYEICLGRSLPSDGDEWQAIRAGQLEPLEFNGTPYEMELIIKSMMHPDPNQRPSASELLKRKQLLSEEQKQLMAEKSKVLEANLALALQTQKIKKLTPPRPGGLMRANTWNGGSSFF